MLQFCILLLICSCYFASSVQVEHHEDDLAYQLGTMKNTVKVLSDQWEKWNALFITSLEPRITSTASTLSSIDSNIHNLQERAHVWDTFQLHVAAWNDQLATMDRKIDILNKAIEQLTVIDTKMNTILSEDFKLDKLIKMTNSVFEVALNIESSLKPKQQCKRDHSLFEEFAARGILSSLKLVERKVDQLLSVRQSNNDGIKSGTKNNNINNNVISKNAENLISDIASKVDIIFDTITKPNENDYSDEYIEFKDLEGSGSGSVKHHKRNNMQQNQINCKPIEGLLKGLNDKITNIDDNLLLSIKHLLEQFSQSVTTNQTKNFNFVLDGYFHENQVLWTSILNEVTKKCSMSPTLPPNYATTETVNVISSTASSKKAKVSNLLPTIVDKHSCSELNIYPSGIYIFKNNFGDFLNEKFFNKQFCELRDNSLWTVIQRRDNYSIQQDFNVSWHDYKTGFGDLQRDFWIGNNYLAKISNKYNLTLRIELEDFDGNSVWAEYTKFIVAGENQQFQLTVQGYSGNASDAFSSHSGSRFSTFDKKNDEAPDCCPCSLSYGGGWWFNRCFESNLNGVYYKKPFENDYYRGIIWEHWLGNYSLKKSLMMVKSKSLLQFYANNGNKVEDP